MELKFAHCIENNVEISSNRTFMELKLAISFVVLLSVLVLIVPLWN